MEKRIIQTHWNGKMKKLAGIVSGALGEENRRMKRPEPHFGFGRHFKLYDDGRLEIERGANEVDVIALMDILVERGIVDRDIMNRGNMEQGSTDKEQVDGTGSTADTLEEGGTILPDAEIAEDALADNEVISADMAVTAITSTEAADVPEGLNEPNVTGDAPADEVTENAEMDEESDGAESVPVSAETPVTAIEEADETGTTNEPEDFTVSVPRETLSDAAIDNIRKMVAAKAQIFKKSIGTDSLSIDITDESVAFPWFKKKDACDEKAYTDFISLLCEKARNVRRVTAKERDVTNERYAMRVFLISLGGNGKEYSLMRKIMLKNLAGSSAFRDKKRRSEILTL